MNEIVDITIDSISEPVSIAVACDDETVDIVTSEEIENIEINIEEPIFNVGTLWINLVTGFSVLPVLLITTLPGSVRKYEYLGGAIYYRYIATDGSIDGFYDDYTAPNTLGNLVVEKRIVI